MAGCPLEADRCGGWPRVNTIFEGTSAIQRLIIARNISGVHIKYTNDQVLKVIAS